MAKQENVEPELNPESQENLDSVNPYEEEPKASSSRTAWLKSRGAKIAAMAVGGSLALGAAFVGGVVAANTVSPKGIAADEFGNHGPLEPFAEGQRPPRGPEGDRPQRGGDRDFQVDPGATTDSSEAGTSETP